MGEEAVKGRSKDGQIKYHLFHKGPDRPSHAVEEWLGGLDNKRAKSGRLLLQLIRAMLCIEPHKRPTTEMVADRLRLIVLYYTTEFINEVYDELYKCVERSRHIVEVYTERARYNSWKKAYDIIETEDLGRLKQSFDLNLQTPLEILAQTKKQLELLIPIYDQPQHLLFLPLRHLNNRLATLRPVTSRDFLQNHLVKNIVDETNDLEILEGAQHTLKTDNINKKVGASALIKRMTQLLNKHKIQKRPDLYVNSEDVFLRDQIVDCTLSEIKS